eukprot:jgi/Botrbrau1/22224/Bobra.168_1s0055.1
MMTRKPYRITKPREKWSESEHERFTEGLKLFGRDWKQIVAHVGSRSVAQVRSHAQKYFLKLEKSGNALEVPPPRPKKAALPRLLPGASKEGSPSSLCGGTSRQPKSHQAPLPRQGFVRVFLPVNMSISPLRNRSSHELLKFLRYRQGRQCQHPPQLWQGPPPSSGQASEDCQRISTSPSFTRSNSTPLPIHHHHPSSASMDSIHAYPTCPRAPPFALTAPPAMPTFQVGGPQELYAENQGNSFYPREITDQALPWFAGIPSHMGQDVMPMGQFLQSFQFPGGLELWPPEGMRESSGSSHCSEEYIPCLPQQQYNQCYGNDLQAGLGGANPLDHEYDVELWLNEVVS